MSAASFAGSHVAIVTPLRASGDIDWQAWARLLDFHLQQGSDGIVVGGTTGESVSITDEELHELLVRAREQAGSRMKLLAGIGTSSTAETVRRARAFGALPLDGLLVVTPAYNRPTQEGLYLHFEAVAAAAGMPVMLYNVPSRTAVDLLPETVARLAQLHNIVAVKEAVPSMQRIRELRATCPAQFEVLSGDDATARDALANGAVGVVTVTGNVAPGLMRSMIAAAARGDTALAAQLDAQLAPLHEALFVEPNPIPVKWALARMGLMGGTLRLPLTELSAGHRDHVAAALQAAHIPLSSAA
jgi:4-hydroxy-tetrahydrodipicolinate synthase